MGLGGVISNLLSSVTKLLPVVSESVQAPSSSSSPPVENHQIEAELKGLMRLLERIKATLYDAEKREIIDRSVKLWLKELKQVAYEAEDVIDEYHYEVLRSQIEARDASHPDSRKRKLIQIPDGMFDQIKHIKDKFDEIDGHCIALRLPDVDGARRFNNELQISQTSHFIIESDIFGREMEKEELINILSSDCHDENVVCVVTIVGTGGLGKTTLAQLVYNDQRIKQRFDRLGWICISEDFNVQRLTREAIELIAGRTYGLQNLGTLQNKLSELIRGKQVLLVLDDVWNENRSLWELFKGPLMSAKEAKVLVTTRNESVAKIMQTVPSFKLKYISKEQYWQLFKNYAFGDVNQNEDSKFVEIGKKILEKCGKLPLAVKSIASLLRHETEEENWIDILKSNLWYSDKLCDYIFTPLQISYARLPTCLKPCFVYCSLFPKDYTLTIRELVLLWISQGYIKSNGNKNAVNIGQEYAKQLRQRSFFEIEGIYEETNFVNVKIKLHDIVHDLARLISENECYSIEAGKDPLFPQELYHLYIEGGMEQIKSLPLSRFSSLRTLIIVIIGLASDFEISKAYRLRALKLKWCSVIHSNINISICHLKHLRYLSLQDCSIPEYLYCLYLLQYLTIKRCPSVELSESIENLVNLEVVIEGFVGLKKLPTKIGNLKNIRTLKICRTGISSLPSRLKKIIGNIQTLHVRLTCRTIGWLNDFVDLKGTLIIKELCTTVDLADAQCANIVSMHNLECLMLIWHDPLKWWEPSTVTNPSFMGPYFNEDKSNQLQLRLRGSNGNPCPNDKDHFLLMTSLQPHPNLKELHIRSYPGITFPECISNPTSCASLEKVVIANCSNLKSLSFSSLSKLKYIDIYNCCKLQFLGGDSLQLQELRIGHCIKLKSLVMDANESTYHNSLLGLRNLTSLRRLEIIWCGRLRALVDEPRPVESCEVEISYCPGLRDWCSHHSIPYEGYTSWFATSHNQPIQSEPS